MNKYMRKRTSSYTNLHDVIYAVIHAGEEYRRRYLDIRENCAMEENGDIDV